MTAPEREVGIVDMPGGARTDHVSNGLNGRATIGPGKVLSSRLADRAEGFPTHALGILHPEFVQPRVTASKAWTLQRGPQPCGGGLVC